MYILKKERNNLAFFYVLCKRMLRSFTFFAKVCCVLCVLLGLISRQKLEKWTEKKGTFFLKNGKERNLPNGKECGAQPYQQMIPYVNRSLKFSYKSKNVKSILCAFCHSKKLNIFRINMKLPNLCYSHHMAFWD